MSDRNRDKRFFRRVLLGAGFVVILWATSAVLILRYYRTADERAAFGDVFGAVNALFSGLAFLGLIVAIILQKEELEQQRAEMMRSRKAQEDSARALERRFSFDEELVLKRLTLDLYNEWHAPDMHSSRIELARSLKARREAGDKVIPLSDIDGQSASETVHVFRIYHFFEKWTLLAIARQIDQPLLLRLLRIYANWWDKAFFTELQAAEKDIDYQAALRSIRTQVLEPARSLSPHFVEEPEADSAGS